METKICNKCKKELYATTEYFYKEKNGKYGVRATCKQCDKQRHAEYRKNDPEYKKMINKRHYENNKDMIRDRSAKYAKQYYKNNKDKCIERFSKWRSLNKETLIMYDQRRKSRERNIDATLTIEQWEQIKKDFDCRCAYCGISEEDTLKKSGEKLHQEHFIALNKGGEYSKNNIIPSCRSCNSSKHDSDFFKWYKNYDKYDKEREKFLLDYLGYDVN